MITQKKAVFNSTTITKRSQADKSWKLDTENPNLYFVLVNRDVSAIAMRHIIHQNSIVMLLNQGFEYVNDIASTYDAASKLYQDWYEKFGLWTREFTSMKSTVGTAVTSQPPTRIISIDDEGKEWRIISDSLCPPCSPWRGRAVTLAERAIFYPAYAIEPRDKECWCQACIEDMLRS